MSSKEKSIIKKKYIINLLKTTQFGSISNPMLKIFIFENWTLSFINTFSDLWYRKFNINLVHKHILKIYQ